MTAPNLKLYRAFTSREIQQLGFTFAAPGLQGCLSVIIIMYLERYIEDFGKCP